MKKLTIYQMAKKAKVSIATISRAINSRTRHKVKPATLEKIDRLIEQSGYTPNLAAKNLSQASSRVIGVVVPQIPGLFLSDYYSKILAGVSDALLDSDYQFKMVMLQTNGKNWDAHDFRHGEGVDGLIVAHWPRYFSNKSFFEKLKIPSAIINDLDKDLKTHQVSCDNEAGGRLAAESLLKQGHRQIAVLTGPKWSTDSHARFKGFKEALKQKGVALDPALTLCAHYQEKEAMEKTTYLVREKLKFTALFSLNDAMARGAIQGLNKAGLQCPKNVSVIGFDDDPASAFHHPPLTTVHHPMYDIAKGATQILVGDLQQRKGGRKQFVKQVFPVYLVERGSVAKVK